MRKKSLFSGILTLLMFASFMVFGSEKPTKTEAINMPDNVKEIIQNKCFGCHNTDSKNDKAKKDLDFKSFDTLSKVKMITAYKEIGEVVEENEMPPKKFLDKYPDKKLTKDEAKILMDWASKEAKALKSN